MDALDGWIHRTPDDDGRIGPDDAGLVASVDGGEDVRVCACACVCAVVRVGYVVIAR